MGSSISGSAQIAIVCSRSHGEITAPMAEEVSGVTSCPNRWVTPTLLPPQYRQNAIITHAMPARLPRTP